MSRGARATAPLGVQGRGDRCRYLGRDARAADHPDRGRRPDRGRARPQARRLAPTTAGRVAAAGHHIRAGATAPAVDPTLPAPLRRALARHGVVVAVLYAPGDEGAVATARAGAASAHAGFATLDVRDEAVARAVALKLTGETDPSVLVVTRPGKIALVLSGYAGADVVAQAAAAAR